MSRNVAALNELADFVERADYGFDMADGMVRTGCGTAGCIAGHAAVLWPDVREDGWAKADGFTWEDDRLCEKLGLTKDQHEDLFFDVPGCADGVHYVDRAMAIAAVRRFAATGEIRFDDTERTTPRPFDMDYDFDAELTA
jgi:hypothetical protein